MSVKYAVFDLGGVVLRNPFEMARDLERRKGLAPGEFGVLGPFDPSRDQAWQRRLACEISEREYWAQQASSSQTTFELMHELYDVPEDRITRPEMVDLIDDLEHRGFRITALTNDLSRHHSAEWISRISILRRFDPLIDLSEPGVFKPDPGAFLHALEALAAEPDELLFIDDAPENVRAAREIGIPTVEFDALDVAGSLDRIRAALDV